MAANHPQRVDTPPPPLNRQFPFATVKPPYIPPPADYHRFPPPSDTQTINVNTPPMKRKSYTDDHKVEPSDWTASTGYTEVVAHNSFQTPKSGKAGKGRGSRVAKFNRTASQTPVSNAGSPANNLTPIGPCRYDSSLGLLTKKFINLIKQAEDGILDLNQAADTLECPSQPFGTDLCGYYIFRYMLEIIRGRYVTIIPNFMLKAPKTCT